MNLVRHFFPRQFWIPAICAALLTGCGHSAKNDPVVAMNEFFNDLARQHYQEAFESISIPLQVRFNETAFEAVIRDTHLGDFASCTWTPESNTGKEARLKGELVAKNFNKLPLQATLIREDGRWKLYSLETAPTQDPTKLFDIFGRFKNGVGFIMGGSGPGSTDVFSRKIPTDEEIRRLVTETVEKFNEALHKKDFQGFYDYTSSLWQARTTEEQVARAFKPYIDAGANFDFIKDYKMIFDEPPRLSSEGYLTVSGYYPTDPKVLFHFEYIYEIPRWKIIGITISLEPVSHSQQGRYDLH